MGTEGMESFFQIWIFYHWVAGWMALKIMDN